MATFGKTDVPAGWRDLANGVYIGSKYSLTEAGEASKMSFYVDGNGSGSGTQTFIGGLYPDSGGNTGALVAQTAEILVTDAQAAGWVDGTFASGESLSAGDYWLVVFALPATRTARLAYAAVAAAGRYHEAGGEYPDLDADGFAWDGSYNYEFAINVTYTPTASGLLIPVAMHHYRQQGIS